jgi:hypothetical protein
MEEYPDMPQLPVFDPQHNELRQLGGRAQERVLEVLLRDF